MTNQIIINKTGVVVEVAELPKVASDFVFNYGLKQILNDCHSSIKRADFKTEEEFVSTVMEAVNRKIAALVAGNISVRVAKEALAPIDKIIQRMAQAAIRAALKAKGVAVKQIGEEKFAELVENYSTKHAAKLRAEAQAELDRAKNAPDVEIDLTDLGL